MPSKQIPINHFEKFSLIYRITLPFLVIRATLEVMNVFEDLDEKTKPERNQQKKIKNKQKQKQKQKQKPTTAFLLYKLALACTITNY
jgi:FPC/CPF motif-containing protein YcgG